MSGQLSLTDTPEEVSLDRIEKTGWPTHDRKTGWPTHDRKTGQLRQENRDRTIVAGEPGHDNWGRKVETEQLELVREDRSALQFGLDRSALTDLDWKDRLALMIARTERQ